MKTYLLIPIDKETVHIKSKCDISMHSVYHILHILVNVKCILHVYVSGKLSYILILILLNKKNDKNWISINLFSLKHSQVEHITSKLLYSQM